MVGVFVDTSAWYALRVANDREHARARAHLQRLAQEGAALHTSDWILVETTALLRGRAGRREAVEAGEWLLGNPIVTVHALGESRIEAWNLFRGLAGKVSLVDCGSFALMSGLGISRAFAFDPDFKAQGFLLEP